MTNKAIIKKLRDNAELAWAAYAYFDLMDKQYSFDEKDKNEFKILYAKINNLDESGEKVQNAQATLTDILNIEYKKIFKGDFAPLQAQNFFEKYDLLIHQPNTESGFSATLFQNKESKEFTLAIISTESKCDGIK